MQKHMPLTVQGVEVYLVELGSDSPTLLLHGAPGSAEMWNGMIEQLQDSYHCFAPDLPGFGRSAAPAEWYLTLLPLAPLPLLPAPAPFDHYGHAAARREHRTRSPG